MPLHDWSDDRERDGFHDLWIGHLLRSIKARLAEGYRARIGTSPDLVIGGPPHTSDVHVRDYRPEGVETPRPTAAAADPYAEFGSPLVSVPNIAIDPQTAIHVSHRGRTVAAVELISPRNKDRLDARTSYTNRYVGYMRKGASVLVVDVHRRPLTFSFADALSAVLELGQPPTPGPFVSAYRVSETMEPGRTVDVWCRTLRVGEPIPAMPLPLSARAAVKVDLEGTYMMAAEDSYMA